MSILGNWLEISTDLVNGKGEKHNDQENDLNDFSYKTKVFFSLDLCR